MKQNTSLNGLGKHIQKDWLRAIGLGIQDGQEDVRGFGSFIEQLASFTKLTSSMQELDSFAKALTTINSPLDSMRFDQSSMEEEPSRPKPLWHLGESKPSPGRFNVDTVAKELHTRKVMPAPESATPNTAPAIPETAAETKTPDLEANDFQAATEPTDRKSSTAAGPDKVIKPVNRNFRFTIDPAAAGPFPEEQGSKRLDKLGGLKEFAAMAGQLKKTFETGSVTTEPKAKSRSGHFGGAEMEIVLKANHPQGGLQNSTADDMTGQAIDGPEKSESSSQPLLSDPPVESRPTAIQSNTGQDFPGIGLLYYKNGDQMIEPENILTGRSEPGVSPAGQVEPQKAPLSEASDPRVPNPRQRAEMEIDEDELLDILRKKLNQEYKRFYGK